MLNKNIDKDDYLYIYKNKWCKLLGIMQQISEENIELNIRHIEYLFIDYNLLTFLAIKEIKEHSKYFDRDCANCGLDCNDILFYNFLSYIKSTYNLKPEFYLNLLKKVSHIKDNDVKIEYVSGFFDDDNWKLNILTGINSNEDSKSDEYNSIYNYNINDYDEILNTINLSEFENKDSILHTEKLLEPDDSIENYIL